MIHSSHHRSVNPTDAYFSQAYWRMATKLLNPFSGDPSVRTFLDGLTRNHVVQGPTEDDRDLPALGVTRSFVVPGFPTPTLPAYRNEGMFKNPIHLFTRMFYKSADKPGRDTKEDIDKLWLDRAVLDSKHEGWPSCVALPRVIDGRNLPETRRGTPVEMADYIENDYKLTIEHDSKYEMWHQLEIKAKDSEPTKQKHKDELRRGMPESPLITYFRLNVVKMETLETISSSIFRCVIVEEHTRNGITHRPWKGADGFSKLPALRQILSGDYFDDGAGDHENAYENESPLASPTAQRRSYSEAFQPPVIGMHGPEFSHRSLSRPGFNPNDLNDLTLPPLQWSSDFPREERHYSLSRRQCHIYGQTHARLPNL